MLSEDPLARFIFFLVFCFKVVATNHLVDDGNLVLRQINSTLLNERIPVFINIITRMVEY